MNRVRNASAMEEMIQRQMIDRGITDARVLDAIRGVPREKFFAADDREAAYADRAAPIGHGQTISQPYMVALMTERLRVQPHDRVLEIGTGSGYQTAILAALAAEVYTVERVKPLLDDAWERVMDLGAHNVHFKVGDGSTAWAKAAPFDRMLLTAGVPELPKALILDQLVDGGAAVLPVGPGDSQMLIEAHRHGAQISTIDVCPCRFVKLIGAAGWNE